MMVSTKALGAIALTMIVVCPVALGYMLSVHNEEIERWKTTDQMNISDMILNHYTPYYMTFTGSTNNNTLITTDIEGLHTPIYNDTSQTYSSYPVSVVSSSALDLSDQFVTISASDFLIRSEFGATLRLDYYGGNTETITLNGGHAYFFKTSSGIAILSNGNTKTEYTQVRSVDIKGSWASHSATLEVLSPNGQYADLSAGWTLPNSTSPVGWTNGQQNTNVELLMGDISPYGYAFLRVNSLSGGSFNDYLRVSRSAETNEIFIDYPVDTRYVLGDYEALRFIITPDKFIIEGLSTWYPYGMGDNFPGYGRIEIDHTPVDYITSLGLSGNKTFRVDNTTVLAGSYPSTYDYTLDLNSIYFDGSKAVKFNSIGMYGDSITIGDNTYSVNKGKILIGGKTVNLRGAVISFLPVDSSFTGTINGYEFGTFADIPSIIFNGDWSLTAIAYKLENTTATEKVWHAGEFGLDKNGLIAGGLIMAVVAFIACGMSGRMSGAKVAVLSIICGGAALVYLIML